MATIKVNGMSCEHCKKAVETAVKSIPGVKDAQVDLASKELTYENSSSDTPVAVEIVMEAIRDLGYEPVAPR